MRTRRGSAALIAPLFTGPRSVLRFGAALGLLAGVLLISGAPADAALTHPYVSQLTGAKPPKQIFSENLCGVNIDPGSGETYVADLVGKPGKIQAFGPTNAFVAAIKEKVGAGACSTAFNDAKHRVYVANPGEGEKAPAKASAKSDAVFVYDNPSPGTYTFNEGLLINGSETPAKSFLTNSEGTLEAGGSLRVAVVQAGAAADNEDIYVSVAEQGVVDRFEPEGKYLGQLTFPANSTPQGIATDSSGNVYVVVEQSTESQLETVIDEFSPSGALVRQITGGAAGGFRQITGVAVDAAGHVYVSDAGNRVVDEFDPNGGFMAQITGGDTPAGSLIEPAGVAVNQTTGNVYVAERTEGRAGGSPGVVNEFAAATPEAPFLLDEGAASVTATTATLQARLNHPAGSATKYHFEYAPEGGAFTSTPEAEAGPGEDVQLVTADLENLSANTTYQFRALVTVSGHATEEGALETFTTQTEGAGLTLPDGRGWQLVSPPNKFGAVIQGIGVQGVVQAATDGSRITYTASSPIELGAPANASESPALSTRSGGTWATREILSPAYAPAGQAVLGHEGLQNRIFSPDLSHSILQPFKEEPLLSPEASERGPYVRNLDDATCDITQTTCYTPLVTKANDTTGIAFGGGPLSQNGATFGEVTTATATPDLSHVALESKVPLKSTHVNEVTKLEEEIESGGLYEWTAGKPPAETLQLISVLPTGVLPSDTANVKVGSVHASGQNTRNAISADGSRIVWSTTKGALHLYVRDTTRGETVQLDLPNKKEVEEGFVLEGESNPSFQTANTAGSIYYFTDDQKLTKESAATPGSPDLYACQIAVNGEGKLVCNLTDLTNKTIVKNAEPAAVQGALPGASDNGSELYFVANGVLSNEANAGGEKAAKGGCGEYPPPGSTCNLYAEHLEGETWEAPRFIAKLSSDDGPDWGAASNGERRLDTSLQFSGLTSRVSSEGNYLAFMSDRRLTGYDNTDANKAAGGAADEEVFRYDLSAGSTVCVSCNRSGARPHGVYDQFLNEAGSGELVIDHKHVWGGRWLAGSIPGWSSMSRTLSNHQPRYLSNSGRMFFNSSDSLVHRDTNGVSDVYEFDPNGVGSCTVATGCQSLISAGESGQESAFMDASETGDDVFFLTTAKLVPEDVDTSYDVYDAHVCTGEAPCLTPPTPTPPCGSSLTCQGAPGASPGAGETPASSNTPSSGNVVQGPAGLPAQGKLPSKVVKPTRAQLLSKALKSCKKLKKKKKRVACEKSARKKYGAKKASKGKK